MIIVKPKLFYNEPWVKIICNHNSKKYLYQTFFPGQHNILKSNYVQYILYVSFFFCEILLK